MKEVLLIILLSSFIFNSEDKIKGSSKQTKNVTIENVDEFKKDILKSVYEFIESADLNPDSCYIPFKRDSIK